MSEKEIHCLFGMTQIWLSTSHGHSPVLAVLAARPQSLLPHRSMSNLFFFSVYFDFDFVGLFFSALSLAVPVPCKVEPFLTLSSESPYLIFSVLTIAPPRSQVALFIATRPLFK